MEIVLSVLSTVFGGLGAYASMYSTFRRPNKWEDFKKYVKKTELPKDYEGIENYDRFLAISSELLPMVQQRIKQRFLYVLLYIITSGLVVGFDIPLEGEFLFRNLFNTSIELIDILTVASYIVIFILFRSNYVIGKVERDFLRNYRFLFDKFYRDEVKGIISDLNKAVWTMHSRSIQKFVSNENLEMAQELKQLNDRLLKLEKNRDKKNES